MIDLQRIGLTQGDFSFREISFTVPTGSYGVLMGATGCGKTTLLEAICGLRKLNAGRIVLGESDVTDLRPACRGVGYVPQDGTLFGSMSVRDNLAFAISVRRWKAAQVVSRVEEISTVLGISTLLDRQIKGLSGGERQRVSLGRALAFRPRFLLLDEPLSSVDEATHSELCDLLKTVQREMQVTILHVTHSQSEADRLADVQLQVNSGSVSLVDSPTTGSQPHPLQQEK